MFTIFPGACMLVEPYTRVSTIKPIRALPLVPHSRHDRVKITATECHAKSIRSRQARGAICQTAGEPASATSQRRVSRIAYRWTLPSAVLGRKRKYLDNKRESRYD